MSHKPPRAPGGAAAMAEREQQRDAGPQRAPRRLGLVVHPSRAIDRPLRELREWAALRRGTGADRRCRCAAIGCPPRGCNVCDLLVSIGGDGTALAAIRAGSGAARPILAVTCGSLGVLTSVPASAVVDALERFSAGGWVPRHVPALEVERELGAGTFALNDIAIVRAGEGQIRLTVYIDGNLVARIPGDGCVVSTPLGFSAYALAAGGPLPPPDMPAFLFTPLLTHGGSCPPVVVDRGISDPARRHRGHGGARLELDGQVADTLAAPLTIRLRAAAATLVTFPDQEPLSPCFESGRSSPTARGSSPRTPAISAQANAHHPSRRVHPKLACDDQVSAAGRIQVVVGAGDTS
jgi:NAD+ kinase